MNFQITCFVKIRYFIKYLQSESTKNKQNHYILNLTIKRIQFKKLKKYFQFVKGNIAEIVQIKIKILSFFKQPHPHMKSQSNNQLKSSITKKNTKPLNQKKNSLSSQNTLNFQATKHKLSLNDFSQTNTLKNDKFRSTKNNISQYAIMSPKTQSNEQFFKAQKSQIKKSSNLNKLKKVSKHQPIKKEQFVGLKSPKGTKINTVQSQIYLNTERQNISFNQQSNLNIKLDTSIAANVSDFIQQKFPIQSILRQNQKLNVLSVKDIKIQQLTNSSNQQKRLIKQLEQLNDKLKQQNQQLERKLQKLKLSQQQNRKKLRQRISTFNEQGQQTKLLKEKVSQLQKQILKLQDQSITLRSNTQLKLEVHQTLQYSNSQDMINQIKQAQKIIKKSLLQRLSVYEVLNMQILAQLDNELKERRNENTRIQMIDESVMTQFQQSILQRFSFNKQLGQTLNIMTTCNQSLLNYNQNSFQIQLIKSSYEQKYKQKINELDLLYEQNNSDIQNRYKVMISQFKQTVKSQQREIFSLQSKLDQLYEKLQDCACSQNRKNKKISIQTDDQKLKLNMIINTYKKKVSNLEEQIKTCHQDLRSRQIQCKKVLSELDIQRIKHSLNNQSLAIKKQINQFVQNQQFSLIKQQLKLQKQKYHKALLLNQKKEELIRKFTNNHHTQMNSNSNYKKTRK